MIVIPARLESTRFPRKLLVPIQGVPMVVATARNAQKVDEVIVACDDALLLRACEDFNIKAILTNKAHTSGTDRCAQACTLLNLPEQTPVLNLQGDEPFLEPEIIATLLKESQKTPFMHTCIKEISPKEAQDPNVVKVVCGTGNRALYFSRAPIPYGRDEQHRAFLGHIGIYGFRVGTLLEFCALEKSPLEDIEKLEQLRALYHHKAITTSLVKTQSVGIDTLQDLQEALKRC
ncbi:3-deoxy-manno-octulosonate cytidylyltransferase KdsB [Helicobacter sp. NHP19-003]|uniref:3-deoxy-manno-octulosonate cytidylyltransferase KdsB n=1 Tax=Helicobacter gastrocanis TaxID=2849641 RepID=A0ABM7SAK3_9HELI|nr:3-deoxy-manno-octulosonate cytidylyltransferase [Helicobacter sp. NHP19-003]BCZ17398.1 3-deoxy-manno-octulosonate cytidylyltransferase KdsB [Helicobacter sp. NHP19-003]